MTDFFTEGLFPPYGPVPVMPPHMRDGPCIYGHILTQDNVDVYRKQRNVPVDEWDCNDPDSVASAAYNEFRFMGCTKTVYVDDGSLAECLVYILYYHKGKVADLRLPGPLKEDVEKSLGIQGQEPRWYRHHQKTRAERRAELLAQYKDVSTPADNTAVA